MPTRDHLIRLIDDIEAQYLICWNVLRTLKETKVDALFLPELLKFQPTLRHALLKQEDMRDVIHKEKRRLITKKENLNSSWFRKRMRSLDNYLEILDNSISIGKCLGDSFAWLFYQRDRHLLRKHCEAPRVFHTPTRIGGLGELQFINNIQRLQGQIVICHSTTTFLRLGDLSLIDPQSCTVSAIGELKTRQAGDQQLVAQAIFLSPKAKASVFDTSHQSATVPPDENLPPQIRDRLLKQLGRMAAMFSPPACK